MLVCLLARIASDCDNAAQGSARNARELCSFCNGMHGLRGASVCCHPVVMPQPSLATGKRQDTPAHQAQLHEPCLPYYRRTGPWIKGDLLTIVSAVHEDCPRASMPVRRRKPHAPLTHLQRQRVNGVTPPQL